MMGTGRKGTEHKSHMEQTLKQRLKRDKEGHYIMIKRSIQEEDIKIVNVYVPNIGTPQYTSKCLLIDIKGKWTVTQ